MSVVPTDVQKGMTTTMINEVIKLRPENPDVTLTTYVSTDTPETPARNAILVLPGGGYHGCAHHEGEKIALNYLAAGINAFVLNYSTRSNNPNMKYPMPLVDASNAMKHIRDNAQKYNINPDRVYVLGFSAGGHLAATLGTFWHRDEVYAAAEPMEYGYNKPSGMILCYPVITPESHIGSYHNLLSEDATKEELEYVAPNLYVDERTSPAFIWHTSNDNCVDVRGSLSMAKALKDVGTLFEMHIYPDGYHGLGYPDGAEGAADRKEVAAWMKDSIAWIRRGTK